VNCISDELKNYVFAQALNNIFELTKSARLTAVEEYSKLLLAIDDLFIEYQW